MTRNKTNLLCARAYKNRPKRKETSILSSEQEMKAGFMVMSSFVGLGVSVLAFGTQVCGFKPGRSHQIFKGEKILSTPSHVADFRHVKDP
jgi:hypothetical protein